MKELKIKINRIEDIKCFVNIVSKYNFDIDILSGRYLVDAKSIMGLFSIDLSNGVQMNIHSDDCETLLTEIKDFIV